jgi:hypothetical protein
MPTPGTLRQLCGPVRSGGYVYALLYSTRIVQVGRTQDSRAEMARRRSTARSLGVHVDDWWFSEPMQQWAGGERQLAAACRGLGGREAGAGSYSGVDFTALCGQARDIRYDFAAGQRPYTWSPDQRMAVAARLRAEGVSLRDSAKRMLVHYSTVSRDLARWDRVKDGMPEEVTRLSAPVAQPIRCIAPAAAITTGGPASPGQANATAACNTATVIPLRRPA